jgi:hypothetical protein
MGIVDKRSGVFVLDRKDVNKPTLAKRPLPARSISPLVGRERVCLRKQEPTNPAFASRVLFSGQRESSLDGSSEKDVLSSPYKLSSGQVEIRDADFT